MVQDLDDNLLKQALTLCKRAFFYNFIFSFFINILMLSTSIYSLQVLDRVLSSGSVETLMMLSLIMIVVYVILAFLQVVRSFVFTQISNWLDSKLSSPLLEAAISFGNYNSGSQNVRDLATIKSFITGHPITHLFDAPWAILYFIVIFFIHWINGFIVVLGAAILFILAFLNEKLTKKQVEKVNETNIISMKNVESIARNSEVIKAMGMKGNITHSWQKINQKLVKYTTHLQIRSNLISHITKSIRLLIQMVVMGVGAVLVIKGKMSAGGIIATSILSGKALAPFDNAVNIYKALINSKKSYERLSKSLEGLEQIEEKIELPEVKGELILEKLVYKLPDSDQLIVKGVNIKIMPGEIIGIIGPSGSGKTSLSRLIVGVIKATKGTVRIDGADIKNQDSEKSGKYIGYLPQDIELFDDTIKANIARMDSKAESENVIQASKFANIHDLVLKLPKGYESKANSLSAGQRQRVALARSFYGKPKVVVLDEPNSNLDTEGEIALLKTIGNAKKAKITTLIISHKPQILNNVDKILVLSNGEAKIFDDAQKVIKKLSNPEVQAKK